MDDHMLDRIEGEINLCFLLIKLEKSENIKDDLNYNAAKVLISAYNKLVKLYYKEEFQHQFLKGSVDKEYKFYLRLNK